ncbi:MAG TPA: amylo-alpha-1,6-glucosidase, partial [Myxococcales bacterium]|nr:amylo-alpha-1,6-glucosidase [Myxococcales bacterium]
RGYSKLLEFRLEPSPTWVYDVGGAVLEKQVSLVEGEQSVVVTYRSTENRRLLIAPFLAYRDYHSLTHANMSLDSLVTEERGRDAVVLHAKPYEGLPELSLHMSPGASIERNGRWYFNTEYLVELERGLDFREDLWKLCTLGFDIGPEKPVFIAATTGRRRFAALPAPSGKQEFVVRRADGKPTIIAGYPWFTDWGRDTMISLPGLLISRGRLDEAREVLRGFLGWLDQGLIPNAFPDKPDAKPEYNTVDATLWMFQAVHAYVQASNDKPFLHDEFFPKAMEILRWHREGTHHGIRVDPADGLLTCGPQLTWMDARVNGEPVTPRAGKPVEINALWYNALRLMASWGATELTAEADRVRDSFERVFWNEQRGCLRDLADDDAVRPNQLFALSLPFPLLSVEQRRSLVEVVEQKLLTPYGLRTLAPGEPGYVSHYHGNPSERDGGYHQGTVWPWLFGPFIRAYLCAFGRTPAMLAFCRKLLEPLEKHRDEACLGSISEVFDAQPPFRPGGAPAQAWSVAELQQLLTVDLA